MTLPVWQAGAENGKVMRCLMRTDASGFGAGSEVFDIQEGEITIHMTATSAMVLRCERP